MSTDKLRRILLYSDKNIKHKTIAYLNQHPEEIKEIIKMSFGDVQPEGWRSAWVLSELIKKDKSVIKNQNEFIEKIIDKLDKFNSPGQIREFLKVILMFDISEKHMGKLISLSFDWLLQVDADKSFKVHGMQIIYNYSKQEPDLLIELKLILEELVTYESPGVKCRASKILAKI